MWFSKTESIAFQIKTDSNYSMNPANKKPKPPPLYLRDKNRNELVKLISQVIRNNNFQVVPIAKGYIYETKIPIYKDHFRKVVSEVDIKKTLVHLPIEV